MKNNRWIKQTTTMKWIPSKEGQYSACTNAKTAGIYVLFGYLDGPTLTPSPTPDLSGNWNIGTEISINTKENLAPSWLQLLSKGVYMPYKTEICHPFNFGLHGWVGKIRQLKDGKWIKLATSTEWLPSTEGPYSSCVIAPEAETYALFGYIK